MSDDVGLQLLQNAVATAGALAALIIAFGPISGAHMNPAVTMTELAPAQLVAVGIAVALIKFLAPTGAATSEPSASAPESP